MSKPSKKTKLKKSNSQNKRIAILIAALVVIVGGYFAYQTFAAKCVSGTFRVGSRGQCVKNIQGMVSTLLVADNTSKYLATDGVYGNKTRDYVALFQQKRRIKVTGVVDKTTWNQLCKTTLGPGVGKTPQWMNIWKIYATNAGCF